MSALSLCSYQVDKRADSGNLTTKRCSSLYPQQSQDRRFKQTGFYNNTFKKYNPTLNDFAAKYDCNSDCVEIANRIRLGS
jgi:hypothetical protein